MLVARPASGAVAIGFDPNDVGELAGKLAIFGEAGLDIAMVTMPTPHDPDHVDLIGNLAESMA